MNFSNSKFFDDVVHLDNNNYSECEFHRCRLIYSGGQPPNLIGCKFYAPRFEFDNQAANTLVFLQNMYTGGFQQMVDQMVDGWKSEKPEVN